MEVLAQGRTNSELAQDFAISTAAVKRHEENLIPKPEASDRTQAVVRVLKLGLIYFPDSRRATLFPRNPKYAP